ncbi:MAG TPA: heavy metal translocating P-type ATPase [Phycisphaerae bacterium]|nr:heavy metal translocating P-type ATPase [Phycisphaerae bacterium]
MHDIATLPPPGIASAPVGPAPKAAAPASPVAALGVHRNLLVALAALLALALWLILRLTLGPADGRTALPLLAVLIVGGAVLIADIAIGMVRGRFGADFLAAISIITALIMGQYLAGAFVVLMLSGGSALEGFALGRASSALRALARRMPLVAHVRRGPKVLDVPVADVAPGDRIVILPHETCPADGIVAEGQGRMDESFLTGEPYEMNKAPGSTVFSGAINGAAALELRVSRSPEDSRYASIMRVMRDAEQRRPTMRRMADRLGAWYTPLAVAAALLAWALSGDPVRFLAVLVVATPCPLLIAIPVAIIGTVSLAARRGIVIRDPAILERIDRCDTLFFDKTGTLTYGRPSLEKLLPAGAWRAEDLLALVASVEQYSRHPLARALLDAAAARHLALHHATAVSEPPGAGLTARVAGHHITITGRRNLPAPDADALPPATGGLECVILIDGAYAGWAHFIDAPRADVAAFIHHLAARHGVRRTVLLTGDRPGEAQRLAAVAGIREVHAAKSPEEKLAIVRDASASSHTLYMGDGVNDAPAMLAATAAIAFGTAYEVTSEAAGAVILEPTLRKLDELLHLARRMRRVALLSAAGGIGLSLAAVAFAAAGLLPPVAGAMVQEAIDLAAVLNALRAAFAPRSLSDIHQAPPPAPAPAPQGTR